MKYSYFSSYISYRLFGHKTMTYPGFEPLPSACRSVTIPFEHIIQDIIHTVAVCDTKMIEVHLSCIKDFSL